MGWREGSQGRPLWRVTFEQRTKQDKELLIHLFVGEGVKSLRQWDRKPKDRS